MIFGIGSDIVHIPRMARLLARYPTKLGRVFTPAEVAYALATADPAQSLAKRFAAKEAFVKALGVGFRRGITLPCIEVVKTPLGKPTLRFHGAVHDWIATHVGTPETLNIHLSLADDHHSAIAFVVIEKM